MEATKTDTTDTPADVAGIDQFDTAITSAEGADMEVRNPKTGEVLRHADGRAFTITLRGRDSEEYRSLGRTQQDRRIAAATRTRTPILTAAAEKDDIELLVRATIKWDIVMGGKTLPSSEAEYRRVYTRYIWLQEQVSEFIGQRANFIKG